MNVPQRPAAIALGLVGLLVLATPAAALGTLYQTQPTVGQLSLAKDAGGSDELFLIQNEGGSGVMIREGTPFTSSAPFAEGESLTQTLTEVLTEEQIAAGWAFVEVSCANAAVAEWAEWSADGAAVTLTIRGGDDITCTWVNQFTAPPPRPTPTPTASPIAGQLPNTAASAGNASLVTMVLTLVGLAATGTYLIARARSRRSDYTGKG